MPWILFITTLYLHKSPCHCKVQQIYFHVLWHFSAMLISGHHWRSDIKLSTHSDETGMAWMAWMNLIVHSITFWWNLLTSGNQITQIGSCAWWKIPVHGLDGTVLGMGKHILEKCILLPSYNGIFLIFWKCQQIQNTWTIFLPIFYKGPSSIWYYSSHGCCRRMYDFILHLHCKV